MVQLTSSCLRTVGLRSSVHSSFFVVGFLRTCDDDLRELLPAILFNKESIAAWHSDEAG